MLKSIKQTKWLLLAIFCLVGIANNISAQDVPTDMAEEYESMSLANYKALVHSSAKTNDLQLVKNAPVQADAQSASETAIETNAAAPEDGSCNWTAGTVYPVAILDQATVAQGNMIYSFGGVSNYDVIANSYKFDGTNWTPIAPLPVALQYPQAVSDGTNIYIMGGTDANATSANTLYRYNVATDTYTTLAPMAVATWNHAAEFLNGKIYKFTGTGTAGNSTNTLEIYDIASNTWTTGAPYPISASFVSSFVKGGFIYGAGGVGVNFGTVVSLKTYRYDPATDTWDDAAIADLPQTRWGAASSRVPYGSTGAWVLAGGYVNGAVAAYISNTVIEWDSAANAWTTVTSMTGDRARMTGAVISAGDASGFFVIGGRSLASSGFAGTNTNQKLTCVQSNPNTAPIGVADSFSTDEDTMLSNNVLTNDSDAENDALTAIEISSPANAASFALNSDGSFSYTPVADFNGTDSFTYKANDGQVDSAIVTVTITVNAVNDAPVLNGVPASPAIDETAAYNFTATATDIDSPAPQFSLVNAPTGAAINAASGAFGWTPTEAQGPGIYNFTIRAIDSSGAFDEENISIQVLEVNSKPTLSNVPVSQTSYWGNAFGFTASATDPDFPANTLTYSLVGASHGATIGGSNGVFSWTPLSSQIGSFTFTVRVADNGSPSLSDEKSFTINVGKRPTAIIYTGDFSEQYSDRQGLTATLTDAGSGALNGTVISGKTVNFVLGSQNASAVTDASGAAAANLILTHNPAAAYNVVSSFAGDVIYGSSSDTDAFDIVQEDARAYYTGGFFVNTSSATSGNATTTLSATVRDITAETGDAAADAFAGDIRNATVTFVNRDASNAPIAGCSNLPVQLVNAADTKTGTVNCVWNVTISGDSSDYRIGIIVNNYYTRNASTEDTVVTVSKPLTTNFITGGGYLVTTNSTGLYAGAPGLKTNFGFNVKYNNSGTNLQGRINVIVRGSNGKVYQIKGNQMDALAVTTVSNNPLVKAATYSGKASVTDITDPLNPISLGGGNSFQMKLTDKGEPGSADTISLTVYGNNNGALLFSSNWNGTSPIEQLLGGGNLLMR